MKTTMKATAAAIAGPAGSAHAGFLFSFEGHRARRFVAGGGPGRKGLHLLDRCG